MVAAQQWGQKAAAVQPEQGLETETAVTQQRGQEAAAAQPGQGLESVATQQRGQEAAAVQTEPKVACLDGVEHAEHYEVLPGPGGFPGMG